MRMGAVEELGRGYSVNNRGGAEDDVRWRCKNVKIVVCDIGNRLAGWRPGGVCCLGRVSRGYDWVGGFGFNVVHVIVAETRPAPLLIYLR